MDGVLIVDKERGCTSHDVVAMARRALGQRRVGHAGTLDPMATGVLVVMLGEATKLAQWLTGEDKTYRAEILLGSETDSFDADGTVTRSAAVPELTREQVAEVARQFVGNIRQQVPVVSAVKVDGQRLYKRRGTEESDVETPVREVRVERLDVLDVRDGRITLEVACSKGFYVRALARDLARALGTVGHLTMLRRVRSGQFDLSRAVSSGELKQAKTDGALREHLGSRLLNVRDVAQTFATVHLSEVGEQHARAGRRIPVTETLTASPCELFAPYMLFGRDGSLLAAAERHGDEYKVLRGFVNQ